MSLRDLRLRRGWSQEQLAVASGVSVRTIQRIEGGQPPSPVTASALAVALDVDPGAFGEPSTGHPDDAEPTVDVGPAAEVPFADSVRRGVRRWGDFEGRASRSEFWFFFLAVLVSLIPLAAAGTRRLRDTDQSPWWLLFVFAPMGFVIPLTLMAMPGKAREVAAAVGPTA